MNEKYLKRVRRAKSSREHIKKLGIERGTHRLVVHRSSQHIYAQVLAPIGGTVLAQASSLDAEVRGSKNEGGKVGISKLVGALVAKRAKQAGVESVACDRSGFKYHGRIKAVVEAARENGLVV